MIKISCLLHLFILAIYKNVTISLIGSSQGSYFIRPISDVHNSIEAQHTIDQ